MTDAIQLGYQILIGLGVIAAAWFVVRSARTKQLQQETAELADVRGERIVELENKMIQMQTDLAKLQGEVEVLRNLKGEEIATIVISKLRSEGLVTIPVVPVK